MGKIRITTFVMTEYVVDNSALIYAEPSKELPEGSKVFVHKAVIRHLEDMARKGLAPGYVGLNELSKMREKLEVIVVEEPKISDPVEASREVARLRKVTLVTADPVQKRIAEAIGLDYLFVGGIPEGRMTFEDYFDDLTMSVHLKEGAPPIAKRGFPGARSMNVLREEPITREEIMRVMKEIVERARSPEGGGYIESERPYSMLIQLRDYRVTITVPPLSDGIEITIVKPVARKKISDYNLPKKLIERLEKSAEGILIAGAPGAGKSTFAQALAEFYASLDRIVKAIESPRDMRLPPSVTSYSKHFADPDEIRDILLLSRPDYTIFDEMRTTEDINLFVDLRLAGIGMIGVIHATAPIDAIQRFIGRIDVGLIPSVIDTVIFIKDGNVSKVYELVMKVKVPTGMRDRDLARPVIEVRDFLTGNVEYEIYTFGEQTFVVPIRPTSGFGELKPVGISKRRKYVMLKFDKSLAGKVVEIYSDEGTLFIGRINKSGNIKIPKSNPIADQIEELYKANRLKFRVVERYV